MWLYIARGLGAIPFSLTNLAGVTSCITQNLIYLLAHLFTSEAAGSGLHVVVIRSAFSK